MEALLHRSRLKHVIAAQQFGHDFLTELFKATDAFAKNAYRDCSLSGKVVALLFYEPSTRTRMSFATAVARLGGQYIETENANVFSSVAKGETLEDTVRVIAGYADAIVLRHNDDDSAERAAQISPIPIINAGSGSGEHPTQALLDLYTIRRELGRIENISIAFAGDLLNGRTIHSLAQVLSSFSGVRMYFVSPPELRMGQALRDRLNLAQIPYVEATALEEIIDKVDVLYQTRIQKERFKSGLEYERLKGCYLVTADLAKKMLPGAILMHPLPRVGEISLEVDELPQAAYFRQAQNGLYVRMALLKLLLS